MYPAGQDEKIGLILGLLEEGNRDKRWLLKEIKKRPNDSLELDGQNLEKMSVYDLLNCCRDQFLTNLVQILKGNDISIPEGIATRTYHWFFSDIVGGSNPKIRTKDQVMKIVILNDIITKSQTFQKRDPSSTIILPTGDGMAIGFSESPEQPVLLTIEIHKAMASYNHSKKGWGKLLLRIGIESGPVYFVKDLEGKDGVWGPGIILTRRIMDLAGDMQIYLGSRAAEELVKINQNYKQMLHYVQTFETNYGEKIPLYNFYGKEFGSKEAPKKKEEHTTKTGNEANFAFNNFLMEIDIKNEKMAAHHSWTWDLVNISKETKSQVFYFLDGQVPKKFGKLNIKITDLRTGKKLQIGKSLDRPLRKEFFVALQKPVKPKGTVKLKLDFDWEMPERMFVYRFSANVKKFNYSCTIPSKVDVKSTILKVDVDSNLKVHVKPPPVVKMQKHDTIISWEKSSIKPREAYQFKW